MLTKFGKNLRPKNNSVKPRDDKKSAFDRFKKYSGVVAIDIPDLSTNKKYLEEIVK
jgi:hypothetical protein